MVGVWLRPQFRRFGFELHSQMRGGSHVPFRIRRFRPVSPVALVPSSHFKVHMNDVTSYAGFSYHENGWHPHVETLKEYQADPSLRYQDSTLGRLHHVFVPRTLREVFFDATYGPMPPLDSLPVIRQLYRYIWNVEPKTLRSLGPDAGSLPGKGSQYFGPHGAFEGEQHFRRLIEVYESIRRDGYRPSRPIGGYIVASSDRFRFVVSSGNHRLAALRVLGVDRFDARFTASHVAVVHSEDLDLWTTDRGALLARRTAEALHTMLLHETGWQRAQRLGLLGR